MGIRLLYFLVITLHTESGPRAVQHLTAQDTAAMSGATKIIKIILTSYLQLYILCQEIRSAEHGQSGQDCHLMDLLES